MNSPLMLNKCGTIGTKDRATELLLCTVTAFIYLLFINVDAAVS